ncbi:MAG: ATPase [Thioalkalivibrio sp.]|jgi:vacuolar-type H+-ATPase subunit F/Vma7|nr:ATPase [Thioalkalivibrio sp.]
MAGDTPALDHNARLVFMGAHELADGFRLIGFETLSNPEPSEVGSLLRQMQKERDRALVVVDDAIMNWDVPELAQLRHEGGRILLVSVPPLNRAPPHLTSEVAQRVEQLFGTRPGTREESR